MTEKPTDLRQHSTQTRRRFIVGGLVLFIVIGTVLVAITYGTPAAGCAVTVFLIALIPVAIITLFLAILQWIVKRAEDRDTRSDAEKNGKT
jgi:uncharacterized membrane protein YhaH (DUF805 family)